MKLGDKGLNVRTLQQRLNQAGAKPPVVVDGWFGKATQDAVKAFQRKHGIVAIGIAGPRTQRALHGAVDPRQVSQEDLIKAAEELGISLAVMAAVAEVESIGEGFFENTDKPVILFERHVFYERAKDAGLLEQSPNFGHKYPNICNPSPGGYSGGAAEYQRFKLASWMSPTIAKESCSWGMFQIMGYHWQMLGYASVDEFVEAMHHSETRQLDAVVRFILSQPDMHQALRDKDWPNFAAMYNGPAYRRNMYDVKLQIAFEQALEAFSEPAPPKPKPAQPKKRTARRGKAS